MSPPNPGEAAVSEPEAAADDDEDDDDDEDEDNEDDSSADSEVDDTGVAAAEAFRLSCVVHAIKSAGEAFRRHCSRI
jgi:hypothetical protein